MANITIDTRKKKGKELFEMLKRLEPEGFLHIERKPSEGLKKSILEAKTGKYQIANSIDELLNILNK